MLGMNTRNQKNRPSDGKGRGAQGSGKFKSSKGPAPKKGNTSKAVPSKQSAEVKAKSKYIDYKDRQKKGDPLPSFNEDEVRLNKYLSNAGVCSRRDADLMIKTGVVSVNGEIVTEMGFKVKPGDVVKYDGEGIKAQTKRYVLLNKPKGFVTTMDDPMGRKTVMSLVKKACKERIYPVGRLDKDTTGLLLFTNDGDLAKKLTHPRHKASKIYHVTLDKKVTKEDLEKLLSGVTLEDGTSRFDKAVYVKDGDPFEIGVELHSGKNRIVRRTFEAMGYQVDKLDRVTFAGLTKKDLPRGMYRHLNEKEVSFLKMTSTK